MRKARSSARVCILLHRVHVSASTTATVSWADSHRLRAHGWDPLTGQVRFKPLVIGLIDWHSWRPAEGVWGDAHAFVHIDGCRSRRREEGIGGGSRRKDEREGCLAFS